MSKNKSKAPAVGNVYYGDTAADYQKKRESTKRWQFEHATVGRALLNMPRGLSVLDVPFGTGRFVPLYHNRAMKVTGLDISEAMLDAARMELGESARLCDLRVGDATTLPFADKSFDLLVSFRFLQNIIPFADVKKCLSEFARVSKESLLEFEVRKKRAPPPEVALDPAKPIRDKMTDQELRILLNQHGLEVINCDEIISREFMTYCAYLCRAKDA